MGCDLKLPSCKLEVRAYDIVNQWEFKDSQDPWPNNGFHVNMSLPNMLFP